MALLQRLRFVISWGSNVNSVVVQDVFTIYLLEIRVTHPSEDIHNNICKSKHERIQHMEKSKLFIDQSSIDVRAPIHSRPLIIGPHVS